MQLYSFLCDFMRIPCLADANGAGRMTSLSENLRVLCRNYPSISQVCREIGINRHQFDRYLRGTSRPSAHNLLRICEFFGVTEKEIERSPNLRDHTTPDHLPKQGPRSLLADIFPGDLSAARSYVGLYHTHFINMTWPDRIQRALCLVREQGGGVTTRYIGRVRDPHNSQILRSEFVGQLTVQGDRVFLLERHRKTSDALAQTILVPPERTNATYITGLAFMMAWRPQRTPFSSRIIWKRLRNSTNFHSAMKQCGLYDPQSPSIDPVIRSFFADAPVSFLKI